MIDQVVNVVEGGNHPKENGPWYSINCHWWDSSVVLGTCPTPGKPGGSVDVWASGKGFAGAVANAIRYVEKKGHHVDQVTANL